MKRKDITALFANDMLVYIENSKESANSMSEFIKVTGSKIKYQLYFCVLSMSTWKLTLKNAILLTIVSIMEISKYKCNKICTISICWKLKMKMKNKKYLNKWTNFLWIGILNTSKDVTFLSNYPQMQCNFYQILGKIFVDICKFILKIIWNYKETRMLKSTLIKKRSERTYSTTC